jgi:hypothetical protein
MAPSECNTCHLYGPRHTIAEPESTQICIASRDLTFRSIVVFIIRVLGLSHNSKTGYNPSSYLGDYNYATRRVLKSKNQLYTSRSPVARRLQVNNAMSLYSGNIRVCSALCESVGANRLVLAHDMDAFLTCSLPQCNTAQHHILRHEWLQPKQFEWLQLKQFEWLLPSQRP